MATDIERIQELKASVAVKLLEKIEGMTGSPGLGPAHLVDLANAYSTVQAVAPKQRAKVI